MSGLECQIENCYHRNQPEGAIPLKFAEIVRVVKRPSEKRTYAEGCFWPRKRTLALIRIDDVDLVAQLRLERPHKTFKECSNTHRPNRIRAI